MNSTADYEAQLEARALASNLQTLWGSIGIFILYSYILLRLKLRKIIDKKPTHTASSLKIKSKREGRMVARGKWGGAEGNSSSEGP